MQVDVAPLASLQKIYCLDLLDCKLSNIEALTSLTGVAHPVGLPAGAYAAAVYSRVTKHLSTAALHAPASADMPVACCPGPQRLRECISMCMAAVALPSMCTSCPHACAC